MWYSQGPSLSSHSDVSISGDLTTTTKPDSVQLLATNDHQDSTSQLATDGEGGITNAHHLVLHHQIVQVMTQH